MKSVLNPLLLLGLTSLPVLSQVHPSYTRQGVTFSPSNLFTGPSSNTSLPLVGGMDVFPDGRVAVAEWGVPGSVFIFDGLAAGSTGVKATRFAVGLDNVLGLKIVNNVIYVMEKEALTQLVDTDGDGVADEYNAINESFPSDNGMLNFSYDLGYLDGSFYAAMSSDVHIGGQDWGSSTYPGTTALPGRSTMYELKMDGTSVPFACGFRNPNGMWTNGTDIFVTDNQGSWLPASKVINVKKGKFYGHRTNPANACQTSNNNSETPPLVWNNWGDPEETGRSSGNGVFLKKGIFKNHILVGETVQAHANKVFRVFVEKIDGELQGAILPFVKSGVSGVFRINEAADGSIYLGLAGSSGYWAGRDGMTSGFDVLRPNTTVSFDVLAIRSKSNNSFELEFTKPVGASAGTAANYTINIWQNVPGEAYGSGNRTNVTKLNVTSATISEDKKKVTLAITGLQTNRLVKFNFANIVAEDNTALFTHFAAYTLNKFGPGTDYLTDIPTDVKSKQVEENSWKLVAGQGMHSLQFFGDVSTPRDIAVYDLKGQKHLEMLRVVGSQSNLNTQGWAKGMYLVRVSGIRGVTSRAFMIP
jgi:glucose/arabinose dehydrogenase